MPRLRRRSPREAVDRLRQFLATLNERRPGWKATGGEVLPRLVPGQALSFPPSLDDQVLAHLRASWPEEARAAAAEADLAAAGRFRLLGHADLAWGTPIDWHHDPVAQRRAPLAHWSRVPFLDEAVVGDHKVIWELNRHQFLVRMAQAAVLTGEPRHAEQVSTVLVEWCRHNPPAQGINWASSLEVSFRAIAWLWAARILDSAGMLDQATRQLMEEALYCHGRHLERYLSTWFSPNTHLTGEALGLLYLGTLMQGSPAAVRWAATGRAILRAQLDTQVQADGTHFEQSAWYHRYTLDFYLHALLLGGWSQEDSAHLVERLQEMTDALVLLVRPDGQLPMLGDDDGGVLVRLDGSAPGDLRGTLALAATVLGHEGARYLAPSAPASLAWLAGAQGLARFQAMVPQAPESTFHHFAQAGWTVDRDTWGPGANWFVFDAGPVGSLAGGHGHADALTFELAVDGVPLLVDPGTGAYVGHLRNQLRATQAHNGLVIAGGSSSIMGNKFGWRERATALTLHASRTGDRTVVEGKLDGFATHARQWRMLAAERQAGWLLLDRVEVAGGAPIATHFQAAAGCRIEWQDGHPVVLPPAGSGARALVLVALQHVVWAEEASLVSTTYGRLEPAPHLVCTWPEGLTMGGVLMACVEAGTPLRVARKQGPDNAVVEVRAGQWQHVVQLPVQALDPVAYAWQVFPAVPATGAH